MNTLYFFSALYTLHYINLSFVFPLRTHTKVKQITILIELSTILFNYVNVALLDITKVM